MSGRSLLFPSLRYSSKRSQESTSSRQYEEPAEQPLPLRSLLTKPVVVSIANYGTLALLEIATSALIPLAWSTAIELCGLSLTPADIGLAVFQLAFFSRVAARFGPGRVVVGTVVAFGLLYALFPFENILARGTGTVAVVWPLIILQLVAISASDMGLGVHVCCFRGAEQAIPWRSERPFADRCLDPACSRTAAAASLFAFSLQNNILGGQFAYVVLLSLACIGLCVAVQLPRNTWKSQNDVTGDCDNTVTNIKYLESRDDVTSTNERHCVRQCQKQGQSTKEGQEGARPNCQWTWKKQHQDHFAPPSLNSDLEDYCLNFGSAWTSRLPGTTHLGVTTQEETTTRRCKDAEGSNNGKRQVRIVSSALVLAQLEPAGSHKSKVGNGNTALLQFGTK
ncbi:hypothetical protein EDB84DRAFT_1442730 [Lactarius hengduanensis]|nr:hypothetical protein EDB84DRAFT_1442730 [Lactarius hengduanensis]